MGYEDGFYIRQYIYGYTGSITSNPTVYFRNGNTFGHITQAHGIKENVGRETKRVAQTYEIINVGDNAQEMVNGRNIHTSRNQFISAAGLKPAELFLLSLAISRFTEEKTFCQIQRQGGQGYINLLKRYNIVDRTLADWISMG
jgi:hypothetical protein